MSRIGKIFIPGKSCGKRSRTYVRREMILKCDECQKVYRRKWDHHRWDHDVHFCSKNCIDASARYGCLKEKKKKTSLKKFGYENASQSPHIKCKTIQTNLDRHGVCYPMQSSKILEKSKKTCLERFGVENVFQSEEIKEKSKQTSIMNWGTPNPAQSLLVRSRIETTCFERYGVKSSLQVSAVRKKQSETLFRNFGVKSAFRTKPCRESCNSTQAQYKRYLTKKQMELSGSLSQKMLFINNCVLSTE